MARRYGRARIGTNRMRRRDGKIRIIKAKWIDPFHGIPDLVRTDQALRRQAFLQVGENQRSDALSLICVDDSDIRLRSDDRLRDLLRGKVLNLPASFAYLPHCHLDHANRQVSEVQDLPADVSLFPIRTSGLPDSGVFCTLGFLHEAQVHFG